MTTKTIYRYIASDGKQGVDTPFIIPGATAIQRLRLIADGGKGITDGTQIVTVIDIDAADKDKWSDCDAPVIPAEI